MKKLITILAVIFCLQAKAQLWYPVVMDSNGRTQVAVFTIPSDAVSASTMSTGASWSTSTQTLAYSGDYTYTGTIPSTGTLPAIVSTTKYHLYEITVKNESATAILTIVTNSGSNDIWDGTTAVSSIVVYPGMSIILIPDGTYFKRS